MSNRPLIGIGVLIINKQNQILLGQRLNAHGANSWSIPGGHLEFGETFEECAIREVYEETGLTIKDPEVFSISDDIFENEEKHYVSMFLKAKFPQGQAVKNLEPHKILRWQWFSINQLPHPLFLPLQKLKDNKTYFNRLENINSFE